MSRWNDYAVVANSLSLTAGTAETAVTDELRDPVVCVALEDLEGATDDTATIEIVGAAATYEIDSRTISAVGSYTVDVPQADTVRFTSSNGVTYSVEVRADPA